MKSPFRPHQPRAPSHVQRGEAPVPPAPRAPGDDSVPGDPPRRPAIWTTDLARLRTDLVEVALWTARHDRGAEHASFLLATADGEWHQVPSADPAATELVAVLAELPGFDRDLLFELLGEHEQRIVTLWRRPA